MYQWLVSSILKANSIMLDMMVSTFLAHLATAMIIMLRIAVIADIGEVQGGENQSPTIS